MGRKKKKNSCTECKQAILESKLYCGRLKEYIDDLIEFTVPCSLFEKEPEAYRQYRRA
ncbi:MAG: hypothetical protein QXN63_00025 [Candidatus Bathyarchaeia archaeon]